MPGLDINSEVMKAGDIMLRHGIPKEEQLEVVRILMACGFEHCLNELELARQRNESTIQKAYALSEILH